MSTGHTAGDHDPVMGEMVVVSVEDEINPTLTGHAGCSYASPPQPKEDGLTLVRVLLGYTDNQADGATRWTCPVAGGRRTVTLRAVPEDADSIGEDEGTHDAR